MKVRSKSTNLCPPIEKWYKANGAYIDEEGYMVLPNINSYAYTYIDWPTEKALKGLYLGADFNKMGSTETVNCHWTTDYYYEGTRLSGNGRAMGIQTTSTGVWRDQAEFGGNNQYGTAISNSDQIRILLTRSSGYATLPYKFKNVSARYIYKFNYFPSEFHGKVMSHNKESQIINFNSSKSVTITRSANNRILNLTQLSNTDTYFKVNNTEYTNYIGKVILEAKHNDSWGSSKYNFELWHPVYNQSIYGNFTIGSDPGSYYYVFDKTNNDTLFFDDTVRCPVGTTFELKWYKYEDFINKISSKDRLNNLFNVYDWYNWLRSYTTTYVQKAVVDDINCIYYRPVKTYNKDWLDGQFEANTQYTLNYKAKGIVGTRSSTGFRFYYTDGTSSGSNVPNESKWVNMSLTSTAGKTVKSIHMGYNYGQGCYIDENSIELYEKINV